MERRDRQTQQARHQPVGITVIRRESTQEKSYFETAPAYSTSNPKNEDETNTKPPKPPLSALQLATVGRLPMHTTMMPPANGPCPRDQELPEKKKKRRRRRNKAKEQAKEDSIVDRK
ncbi:hypothetical protein RR48_04997 [Papilio machaon]|uniref:Uncharacterized protein n=1 Tax=Papilio machaon TaxID=76193 RepID=A0A0N1PFZ6_PAPMA|nr:hypothetical protein RR48_04997 [Papilio machaon]